MSDLSYAVDDLLGLGSSLQRLRADLVSMDGHADFGIEDLGHHRVVTAMDDFRGNWNDNRDHLAKRLGQVGELATKAAEGFSQADRELAAKVRDAMGDAR